jgi:hypothetical protein
MATAVIGTGFSFGKAVLDYFSPSKSPHYSVIVAGSVALVLSCEGIPQPRWWLVAIPVFLVVAVSLALSFENKAPKEGHKDQLLFARSLSVSGALLSLVLTEKEVGSLAWAFFSTYASCLAQLVAFLFYIWFRNIDPEEGKDFNFVQLALETTTLLAVASWSAAAQKGISDPDTLLRYRLVQIGLLILWAACITYWFRHLTGLVRIMRVQNHSSHSGPPAGTSGP